MPDHGSEDRVYGPFAVWVRGCGEHLTNKLLKFILSDVDHSICVSHTW